MSNIKQNQINSILSIEKTLKLLSSKWRIQIIYFAATHNKIRFSSLLRNLEGANKQSIYTALRELEEISVLQREVIALKPLHVEYKLTSKGKNIIPMIEQLNKYVA